MNISLLFIICTLNCLAIVTSRVAFNGHLVKEDANTDIDQTVRLKGSTRASSGTSRDVSNIKDKLNLNVPHSQTPTDLCFIMHYFGSDKGDPINKATHSYTRYYYPLFQPIRNQPVRIFELGLGTNNANIESNMAHESHGGKPGASLRGWRQFFSHADTRIFGGDLDGGVVFEEPKIKTFQVDQLSASSIAKLWKQPVLQEKFDIIIEDALHTFQANVHFFEKSRHKLKNGGIYIIEDIATDLLPQWKEQLKKWKNAYPFYRFSIVNPPQNDNFFDNNLIVAQFLP